MSSGRPELRKGGWEGSGRLSLDKDGAERGSTGLRDRTEKRDIA